MMEMCWFNCQVNPLPRCPTSRFSGRGKRCLYKARGFFPPLILGVRHEADDRIKGDHAKEYSSRQRAVLAFFR